MYISHYHKPGASSDTPLFFTVIHGQMNHMSERNLERIVKKYGEAILQENSSLSDSVYPHMLRRSRASVQQIRDALKKGWTEPQSSERLWEGNEKKLRKMFGLD